MQVKTDQNSDIYIQISQISKNYLSMLEKSWINNINEINNLNLGIDDLSQFGYLLNSAEAEAAGAYWILNCVDAIDNAISSIHVFFGMKKESNLIPHRK